MATLAEDAEDITAFEKLILAIVISMFRLSGY